MLARPAIERRIQRALARSRAVALLGQRQVDRLNDAVEAVPIAVLTQLPPWT